MRKKINPLFYCSTVSWIHCSIDLLLHCSIVHETVGQWDHETMEQ